MFTMYPSYPFFECTFGPGDVKELGVENASKVIDWKTEHERGPENEK